MKFLNSKMYERSTKGYAFWWYIGINKHSFVLNQYINKNYSTVILADNQVILWSKDLLER